MSTDNLELLDKIQYPDDLRKLPIEQLPELCAELRQDIVKELSVNPGHLASSLGVVELTVALHYVLNTPYDRIVWDVGHQAYGHKILTGRKDQFYTNRKLGGIRPFPSPKESEYDTFTCGHASNSISVALGMAVAAHKNNETDRHVVAVIGDGAMSGGLAFEGLNNVSSSPNDLLIILNDNDMSIDHAVGGMEKYLLNLDTNATYNRLRDRASKWLHSKGYLNDDRRKGLIRLNNAIKSALAHQQNIFEGMNIRYFGPFDGNNVVELVRILNQLKDMRGPKLLHVPGTLVSGFSVPPASLPVNPFSSVPSEGSASFDFPGFSVSPFLSSVSVSLSLSSFLTGSTPQVRVSPSLSSSSHGGLARIGRIGLLACADELDFHTSGAQHRRAEGLEDRQTRMQFGGQRFGHGDPAPHDHHVDVRRRTPQIIVAHVTAHHVGAHAHRIRKARNAAENRIGKRIAAVVVHRCRQRL